MKRRRKSTTFNPFAAMTLAMDMMGAGLKTADMLSSSAKVIAHRNEMIQEALSGKAPLYQKEFVTMWQEKIAAGTESWLVALRLMSKGNVDFSAMPTERNARSYMKNFAALMQPYHSKVSANAKRLNKK